MNNFKDKALFAVTNTISEDNLIGEGKITVTRTRNYGSHTTEKCCMVITWEESIEHPCGGCVFWEAAKKDKVDLLSPEDAKEFLRSLYTPTKEEIQEKKKAMEKINEYVKITEGENGNFTAEVPGDFNI